MIWFVTGKPGDGKSYAATRILLELLKSDTRPIVTNIHLEKKAVALWLVSRGGLHPVVALHRAEHRIFYLPDDDLQEFYRHRADVYLDPETDMQLKGRKGKTPDFSQSKSGVIYFLDEIHIAFPARGWQGNGDNVVYYNSQHRKLRDDIYFITQSAEMVDKIFRELAQGTYHCRNHYRLKYGMFKQAGCFNRKLVYSTEKRKENMQVVEDLSYPLEPIVGDCFQTMAGVGLVTGNKPELQKAKGVPLKALWLLVPVAFFVVSFSMDGARGQMSSWFATSLTGQVKAAQATVLPRPAPSSAPVSRPASSSSPFTPEVQKTIVQPRRVEPWPVAVNGSTVVFSDGVVDHLSRHKVTARGAGFVVVDGVTVPASL